MATASATIPREKLSWMYETMVLIRRFEEQAKREADQGRILGTHSAIGEEAVPTGICAHLRDDDYVLGNHRSHHHCIAKGVGVKEMMAELLGKVTGTNRGKGGTMHIADATKGMLGAQRRGGLEHPGSPPAARWRPRCRGGDSVSVVFFGDGASSQGSLHEAMNLASIWKLPGHLRVREQPLRRVHALRVRRRRQVRGQPRGRLRDAGRDGGRAGRDWRCTRSPARRWRARAGARGLR